MIYCYDLEIYPNLFVACFINVDDPTDRYSFVIRKGHSDFDKLAKFLDRDITLVGFNSVRFDDILLKGLISRQATSVKQLLKISNAIIMNRYDDINYWDLYNVPVRFKSIDVMMLHRLRELGVGLKFAGVIIKHPTIVDLPVPPNTDVPEDMFDTVVEYCFNDCDITRAIYLRSDKELAVRRELTNMFGVDVTTMSRSGAAQAIMMQLYSDKTGISIRELRKMNSNRDSIQVKDCIGPNLQFDTPELQNFRKIIESLTLFKNTRPVERYLGIENGKVIKDNLGLKVTTQANFKYKTNITLANKIFDVGIGGLHSRDLPGMYVSDDEWELVLADVSSYYPTIQLVNKVFPQHLGPEYLEILDYLTQEKFRAQAEGKLEETLALKIIINSLFGRLGDLFSPLLDQKAMTTVTLPGQLYLLDFVEKVKLRLKKTRLLSGNTDGVLYLVHRSEREVFNSICDDWANRIGFKLDYEIFEKVIQRDVNNYLAISKKGKIKTKGVFFPGEFADGRWIKPLEKGFDAPIVSIALYKYFVDDVPIETTIRNHTDIYDFMIAKKVGSQFKSVVYDGVGSEVQQKTNRFIITTEGVSLVKLHLEKHKIDNIVKGELLQVLNNVTDDNAHNYPLRYGYYIDRVKKIIDQIDPPQKPLF